MTTDFDSTSTSNVRFGKYSVNTQKNNFEDDDSENFGKAMTIMMPTENINKLQYESAFKDVSLNTKINQIIKNHLDWYSNAPLTRMSYIPKSIIVKSDRPTHRTTDFRVRTIRSKRSPKR